jgi:hypothetical protein
MSAFAIFSSVKSHRQRQCEPAAWLLLDLELLATSASLLLLELGYAVSFMAYGRYTLYY